jgi:hypothetical protein
MHDDDDDDDDDDDVRSIAEPPIVCVIYMGISKSHTSSTCL